VELYFFAPICLNGLDRDRVTVDAMKTWGVEMWLHSFLTSVLDGDGWSI
jgi:hypothetical protein